MLEMTSFFLKAFFLKFDDPGKQKWREIRFEISQFFSRLLRRWVHFRLRVLLHQAYPRVHQHLAYLQAYPQGRLQRLGTA